MALSQAQIETAVEWWAAQLKAPEFKTLSGEERNDPDTVGVAIAEAVAHKLNREQGPPADEKMEAFKKGLRKILEGDTPPHRLDVDYHPDQNLGMVAQAAGLPTEITSFPWKTSMWFRDGGVQVRTGYGAPVSEILKVPPTSQQ
ncbi:MAG: hypothetical protein KKD77_22140 [Gammaproteobacteria bacterium]|nr:hypothetical protein [Gammaproteobacteria bacterium]